MICQKCGKALPSDGVVCKFCGAMLTSEQINERKQMRDPNQRFQPNLMSDRYGVDKKNIYKKDDAPKENKFLGALIIIIILLILIVLAILINV